MNNMYKIILTGDSDDVYVSDVQGEKIAQDWDRKTLPPTLTINGERFKSSSIKRIISNVKDPDSNDRKKRGNEAIQESNESFRIEKNRLLKLSPEERATNTNIAQTLWRAVYGRPMTEPEREEVIKKQTAFFKENPTWAEARPSCYLTAEALKQRSVSIDTKGDMLRMRDLVSHAVIDLMARQVSNSIA